MPISVCMHVYVYIRVCELDSVQFYQFFYSQWPNSNYSLGCHFFKTIISVLKPQIRQIVGLLSVAQLIITISYARQGCKVKLNACNIAQYIELVFSWESKWGMWLHHDLEFWTWLIANVITPKHFDALNTKLCMHIYRPTYILLYIQCHTYVVYILCTIVHVGLRLEKAPSHWPCTMHKKCGYIDWLHKLWALKGRLYVGPVGLISLIEAWDRNTWNGETATICNKDRDNWKAERKQDAAAVQITLLLRYWREHGHWP